MTSRQPHSARIRWWRVIGGVFIALLVLGAAALVRGVPKPPGVSAEEWAYCADGNHPISGPAVVDSAGRSYLGWEGERDWGRDGVGAAEIAEQPGVGTACRIAYELHGLSLAEWKWCYKEPRRVALLAPAVVMLGMGEDEMANADQAPLLPGDDAAEFIQACRLAYHSWRDDGTVSPIADPLSHPLFAVTAEQKAWCGAGENRSVLDWTAMRLGIETQGDAPFIERLTAYVRTCRVASIVKEVPVHVRDGLRLFSPEVREQAELQLAEIERTTGFVGVFVTEQTTTRVLLESDTAPAGPDVRAYLEARYAGDESNDCCAMVYVLREPGTGPCCPAEDSLVPLFNSGRWDEALNAFVSLVEEIAGDPEPPPRRLPDDPFR